MSCAWSFVNTPLTTSRQYFKSWEQSYYMKIVIWFGNGLLLVQTSGEISYQTCCWLTAIHKVQNNIPDNVDKGDLTQWGLVMYAVKWVLIASSNTVQWQL